MPDENDRGPRMGATGSAVGQLDLESLRASFPNWRIGGAPGNWHAVRGGLIAQDGPRSLLRCYLGAVTLMALADRLCLQEYLDGLNEHELADVWQRTGLPQSGQAS